jgi:ATP-dependent exoDNAse (exonuclease V) alpha subunit
MEELDRVVLTVDLPALGLSAGDIGVVVLVHSTRQALEVEFVALSGETVAVVTLRPDQVRRTIGREVPHARAA